jgi:hypothetical protein
VSRYARLAGVIRPILAIAKTRGSAQDFGLHYSSIGQGGLRIEERADHSEPAPENGTGTARKRTKRRT